MAAKPRARNRGVYENTPFLSALNNNVGFVETPTSNPFTITDMRNAKTAKMTGGANQFNAFGTGSESSYQSKASKGGGELPHERALNIAKSLAGTAEASVDANGNPISSTSGTKGGTTWDADWAWNNPQAGVLNWLEQMGYYVDDLNPDPFTQYMTAISAGLPYLYRYSGMQGDTGTANYGKYLEDYTNAMLNTPAGAANYEDSALYDWNEIQNLVSALGGGEGTLTGIGGPEGVGLDALKSLPPDQALSVLMGMLSASSSTAMTPMDFAIMQDEIERGWSQYQRRNTTPREAGAEGTAFWDYLQNSGVLGQLFGF